MEMINALVVKTGQEPRREKISTDLKDLQALVGGKLQLLTIDGGFDLWINEDGTGRLPLNRAYGNHYIYGDFFVTRYGAKTDFADLAEEDAKTLSLLFRTATDEEARNAVE